MEADKLLSKDHFEEIIEFASKVPYSSLNYVDYEDVKECTLEHKSKNLIVLVDYSLDTPEIQYATKDHNLLTSFLSDRKIVGLIKFVPTNAVKALESANFKIACAYTDYRNMDLKNTSKNLTKSFTIDFASTADIPELKRISDSCKGLSRGFNGETFEWFESWLNSNHIIVQKASGQIVGFCCVSIYSEGTTLWIRELAVDQSLHNSGYGRKLLEKALYYGAQKGALKGFLAVDIENYNAIHLYEQYGFVRKEDEIEIQMVRK